jgi:hypothetical protein
VDDEEEDVDVDSRSRLSGLGVDLLALVLVVRGCVVTFLVVVAVAFGVPGDDRRTLGEGIRDEYCA